MRYVAIAAVMIGVFSTLAQAQTMPPPFKDETQIVCADQDTAIELLAVFEGEADRGETLLANLAERDICERITFSGKPVADVYPSKIGHIGGLREGHVFDVNVTSGDVLKGRTHAYMLLFIMHDNEA
jgi:hypothetical protein